MPLPQDSQNVFTDASSTGFVETLGSGALGAPGAVLATVQGTTNLVISPPAYGNAALNGLTLILSVNGGGNVTFTVNVATNFASPAAFLAALCILLLQSYFFLLLNAISFLATKRLK
jgi:hypothetical protein